MLISLIQFDYIFQIETNIRNCQLIKNIIAFIKQLICDNNFLTTKSPTTIYMRLTCVVSGIHPVHWD